MIISSTHPAVALWARHHSSSTEYPKGVKQVPRPIVGTAFFPGGYGIWNPNGESPPPPLSVGKIMVLGHDFHSEVGYRKSLKRTNERLTDPTWRNLLVLLKEVSVEPSDCFFTNVYMGLRAGKTTTGEFPGANTPSFVDSCVSFLVDQLRTQRPRTILTLGVYAPALLGRLSPQLAEWTKGSGFAYLDGVGPVQRDVRFNDVPGLKAELVALIHPCQRRLNVRLRKYKGLTGDEAECAMLREVL